MIFFIFVFFLQRRRERGRIPVQGVCLVETAVLNDENSETISVHGYAFQIGYSELDEKLLSRVVPQYTLYLIANDPKERSDWINAIRQGERFIIISTIIFRCFLLLFFSIL